nr:L-threonylcarbamoyladenylate synthase [uncultured Oribacterium sp.]
METKIFSKENIDEAAEILRRGGLVAFPTETVYGLGGNGLDPEAARKIYAAKGRPSDNPLILHVAKIEEVLPLVDSIPEKARLLMESFWPGPLTLIMKKSPLVPLESTGGLQTVAIRCPDNALTLSLIEKAGIPVAGPSANLSGHPSPTEAAHVYHDLAGRIEGILDDGAVGIGVESTILDMSTDCPTLLRPGAITLKDLEEVLSEKPEVDPTLLGKKMEDGFIPKAPGMKYRHYAPRAEMILFRARKAENSDKRIPEAILRFLSERGEQAGSQEERRQDKKENRGRDKRQESQENRRKDSELSKIAILCAEETKKEYASFCAEKGIFLKVLGKREEPLSMTHNLFRILRDCDEEGVELILSEAYSEEGVGFALMNRMKKAAGQKIVDIDEEMRG